MMMELQKDEARDAPVKPRSSYSCCKTCMGAPPALSHVSTSCPHGRQRESEVIQ
jgi:hypothetical protein